MATKNKFVIVTNQDDHIRWMQSTLIDLGDMVVADIDSLERILQIIDVIGAPIVFVDIDNERLPNQMSTIEGLLTAKPLIQVVAISKSNESQLVLSAMRAGARDFIIPGGDRNQVINLVRRLSENAPRLQQQGRKPSKMVALANARPDSDTVMLALHMALAAQELDPNQKVLLLDVGVPAGDALLYLGVKSSYSFVDAIRSLRRIDETLIKSAFAEHSSGLRILDMGRDMSSMRDVTSADIFVLLGTLRTYFPHIIVNLGGLPQSEFLEAVLRHADHTIFLAEQSVPSVQQNMDLIKHLTAQKLSPGQMSLVIDRYYSKLVPNAEVIAKSFGLPLLATLPPCGLARLHVMNSGMSMFATAPKEQYSILVRKMARQIFSNTEETGSKKHAKGLSAVLGGIRGLLSN